MIGIGTLINVGGIVAGGLGGLLFGRKMEERFQATLMSAAGISVMILGIGGVMEEMLAISQGELVSGGTIMLILSFFIGALVGEWLNIELAMERFGEWLKIKTNSSGDTKFVDGFVTASLTVCIGAMAVVGAIKDGISGDYSVLAVKGLLDMIIILVMTVSLGKGCIFSAVPVGIFQGLVTLLARLIEPIMTVQALSNLSLTGSVLIFCVGVNLVWGKIIKVANLLPAIFFAVIFAFIL
ncbi:MAG: DUF554 domain-containing protein [Lacrimispora sp.]|uniref:DUF554 domain-containing protein n=1 Tax=Lacrimispora sp. TaxID=2719234 RepID=UPI0039E65ED2